MKNLKNINEIEKLIYDNPLSRNLRFVAFSLEDNNSKTYYDCLLSNIVLIDRFKVLSWNDGTLKVNDLPFHNTKNIETRNEPAFNKYVWNEALDNSKKLIHFLEKLTLQRQNDINLLQDIKKVIQHIKNYFNISEKSNSSIISDLQKRNLDTFQLNQNNFTYNLKSPLFFKNMSFSDRNNSIFINLEKIFHYFDLLSKYKVVEIYKKVENLDEYLLNHMKNIYLSKDFAMINIDSETVFILEKINHYLEKEVDIALEKCIEEQMVIMDSINQKFVKVTSEIEN